MKRIIRFCFILASVLFSFSCTNYQDEDVPDGLSISRDELSFSTDASIQKLTVRSGLKWDISSIPEWISVESINPTSSLFEWDAHFSATTNNEYNREGELVFKTSPESVSVKVTQEGKKGKYIGVQSVSLSPKELMLTEGDNTQLTYTVSPSNASIKNVTWESSSPTVATVSSLGIVNAVSAGTSTITVTTEDGNKSSTCVVTVKAKTIPVTSISLDYTNLTITEGDSQALTATITPSNATDKSVTWSSSNTSVATVSSSGVVTGKAAGNATISVKAADGGKTATCVVTVKEKAVAVTGISLNKTSLSMVQGDSQALTATVTPSNATDKTVTWSSSDPYIASVDQSGKVVARSGGSATITATAGGKSATCSVTVTVPVQSISLSYYSLTLEEGESFQLEANIVPSDATDKSITWSSSNSSVATVSGGRVTGLKPGSATITASAGGKKASCGVTVSASVIEVTSISLNKTTLSINKGSSVTLTATVNPSNATDKTVTWNSSNTSIVRVDQNGRVTAIAGGSAIITATAGGKSAICSVTVTVPVQSVSLNISSLTLEEGQNATLIATITPSDATDMSVTWFSSNTSVASVSSSGLVTAKAEGSATITVRANDGGKTATCAVSVERTHQNYSLVSELSLSGVTSFSYDYSSFLRKVVITADSGTYVNDNDGARVYFPKGSRVSFENYSESYIFRPSLSRLTYVRTPLDFNIDAFRWYWSSVDTVNGASGYLWSPIVEKVRSEGNGRVVVGFSISNPYYLPSTPPLSTIALTADDGLGTILRSDWLSIVPFNETVSHLAFSRNNNWVTKNKEDCGASFNAWGMQVVKDLYEDAYGAVANTPSITVIYNNGPVDLARLVSIHTIDSYGDTYREYSLDEFNAKYPSFSYRFEIIPYKIGENVTTEDMYGSIKGTEFTPCYVVTDNNQSYKVEIEIGSGSGISSVGRMPIVMVNLVDDSTGRIYAAGYFKIQIIKSF